ncbi:MAG: hypothetical protein HQK65_14455, partial [Desulfamplus sp.]|nr:hypothetical protein [Desulfamplus sp.]
MQIKKKTLFLIFFMGFVLFLPESMPQARSLTPLQTVIPLSKMDAEALILTVAPNEPFSIAPTLDIPEQNQGEEASLFAIVLHKNWAILMGASGWKPYSGEINMFGKVQLADKLEVFTLDGNQLIRNSGETIDLFYGYAAQEPLFLGNVLKFQRFSADKLQDDIFEISQPAISFNNINIEDLSLTEISDTCQTIAPYLEVVESDLGHQANLFAVIATSDNFIVKTVQGWQQYNGGEILPFSTITLTPEIKEFNLPS